jgi:hypothetical protein
MITLSGLHKFKLIISISYANTNLRVVMSFRNLGVKFRNHRERQGIPRLRRRHRDGRKTVVDRRFCRRQKSNIPKLDSGDSKPFHHC